MEMNDELELKAIRAIGENALKKMNAPEDEELVEETTTEDIEEVTVVEPVEVLPPEPSAPEPVVFLDEDEDDGEDIALTPKKEIPEPMKVKEEDESLKTPPTLTDMVEAYKNIPNQDIRQAMAGTLNGEIDAYQKQLIIDMGFTPEDAAKASWNRMHKIAEERTNEYLEENPVVGVLTIDKSQEEQLILTDEERAKMTKASALRVIVVEEKELETLETVTLPSNEKISFIDSVLGAMSKYGLPMPNYGDFLSFKGAKTKQIGAIVQTEDMSNIEVLTMYASIVYDRLIGGTVMKRTDAIGNTIMSFEEFCNTFPFYDLEMALYTILCASAEETFSINGRCPKCGYYHTYDINLKGSLDLSESAITEVFKDRIDNILKNRSNYDGMKELTDDWNKALRVKSLTDNNVYTLQKPSVSKALTSLAYINDMGLSEQAYSELLMWVKEVRIWNEEKQGYVLLTDARHEARMLFHFVAEMPEDDLQALNQLIEERSYLPRFNAKFTCAKCGNEVSEQINVSSLVFLTVLATPDPIPF